MVDGFVAVKRVCVVLAIAVCAISNTFARADGGLDTVKIGVLTKGNEALTMQRWPATAEYLQSRIPAYKFKIIPLDFHQIEPAVKDGDIDFLLVNPASFVEMESRYGISAVLTLNRRLDNKASVNEFAGVVLSLAGRNDIRDYSDLKGKSFMAVDQTSFGGWAMAWHQMELNGIDPFNDLRSIGFAGSHEAVVAAVLAGKADAGTVRSGVLERMVKEGRLNLDQLQILPHGKMSKQHVLGPDLPLLHSTLHYPEWPLASLAHTDKELVKLVVRVLLDVRANDESARAANITGWTPSVNYMAVHSLMKDLRLAQYEHFGEVGLADVIKQYWYWVVAIAFALIVLAMFSFYVLRLNVRVGQANRELKQEVGKKLLMQGELLAETDKVNKILDNMLEGVVTIDAAGVIQTFNRAAEKIFAYQQSEVLGRSVKMLMPETDAKEHDHHLNKYVATGKTKIIGLGREVFGQRKNGELFSLDIAVSEVIGIDEDERMFIAVMRDLTERKQAEQKIMRLVAAMRCAAEGVFITNLDGEIEYVNPAYEAVTGYSQVELERQKPLLFELAEHDGQRFADFFETLRKGESWSGQYTASRKDGSSYEEEATVTPVLDTQGQVSSFVGVCRDVSEKLMRDQRLLHLEKFELVSKMAGGFAHDFNNLLSSIVGYTDMALLDLDKDSDLAADLGRVLDAASRAKLLVQQLLALGRQGYDEALVFMPQKTVYEVVALLQGMLPDDAVINTDVQDDCCEIFLPPVEFQKVVLSLGMQAIDSLGQENSCIDISLRNEVLTQQQVAKKVGLAAGEYVVLMVSNNGERMEEAVESGVFEQCYTAHDGVNAQAMGLAEVYGIVNHHKGCLEMARGPGAGVSFLVYLPCAHYHQADH